MISFLTSILVKQLETLGDAGFVGRYPHPWIIWEPGAWKPPAKATFIGQNILSPTMTGEGLALALVPAAGKAEMTMGRSPDCDLTINDGTLSSQHLIFTVQGTREWSVADLGSKNGALLNGGKLTPHVAVPLLDGARLVCAQVKLTFHTPDGIIGRLRQPLGKP